MMQIAIAMVLIWCTADIKAAYLNVPRPAGEIPILTKLEPFVAEICELDPNQLYRIDNCLYALPDSGRHFYRHYRDALIEEACIMSNMDNCLFYKTTEEETTFIVLFVDILIFSKHQLDMDQFVVSMNRHYELTLDTKADSFLGINIGHNEDGTVTLTQPKQRQKLFKEHPEEQTSRRKARTPTNPYGPVPSHN